MFILVSNEVKSAMFAKGLKVESDLNVWHKQIAHINLQKLQNMQSKGVVLGLPNFTAMEITGVFEAFQFGKQRRPPFSKERHMSKGILDVVHSDVWGPPQVTTFIYDLSRHTWIYMMR